jgi:hypothetical protein
MVAMLTRPGTAGLLAGAILLLGWTFLGELRRKR